MKEIILILSVLICTFWIIANLVALTNGVIWSGGYECTKHIKRIDIIIPAFKLGCWLGEDI